MTARVASGLPALPLLGLAYAAGVVAGAVLGGGWYLSAVLAALVALAAFVRGDSRALLLLGAVALAAAGHARIEAADVAPPPALAAMTGTRAVEGVVRADAVVTGSDQRVDLDVASVDGAPAHGGIRLRSRIEGTPLRAGERIAFTANLRHPEPFEAFDYAEYLRDRDIYLVASFPRGLERLGAVDLGWRGSLLDLRRTLVERIGRTMPEPAAALAAGVLVGERSAFPNDLDEALRATGTTHLVVVSGQNVALVLGLSVGLLTALISRRIASVITLILLPAYVVFVGADPPVVRAAVMAVAVVAAGVTGRRTPGWVYLAYAVALLLAVEPSLVRDMAFQLSACATAGITMVAPPLRDAVLSRWPALTSPGRAALVEMSATATGAALAVLPVQVASFEMLAPWTVLANVLVAPLYEATVLTAALAALLGGGGPLGEVLSLIPRAFIALVEVLAALPAATVPLRLPLIAAVVFVAALVGLVAWLHGRRTSPLALEPVRLGASVTLSLAVVAAGLWWSALAPGETFPSITVLDVGQGLAVVARDGGRAVLIDTGPRDERVLAALSSAGVGRLDAVVITHADLDHAGGLEAVTRRHGGAVVLAEPSAHARLAVPAEPFDIGDRIDVGRIAVEVLAPPVATRTRALASDNNGSLVLMVSVGERRVLVTGDIEASAEAWLVASGLDLSADVLVVPHHGSKTSSSLAFLDRVGHAVAVIPVGARNPYGHPHPDVLARLDDVALYRTDEDGNVTFRSDGERLWVQTER
ncbi:MAG: DNA internalization-related competence protein ComEC/Rec2 [Dehalococcoidia bacterium]|nr:DNA internalization-related competence protein ComEC/Rec2 [Dehalococcoidia bacterium]